MLRSCLHNAKTPLRLMGRPRQLGVAAQFLAPQLRGRSTGRSLHTTSSSPKWRPVSVLDEWCAKEARPISLRQLMVFGRSLTESRLISSANYVRTELPTRIAHRIRDMQQLPYVVTTNANINEVYDLYYTAFDTFRKVKEIHTLDDNDRFCATIRSMLKAHLTVIPKLARGVLECSGLMAPEELDKFMNTILRSRISRRVIAEQHLALTDTFHAPWFSPGAKLSESEFIGEVFLKCVAKDVIARCGDAVRAILQRAYGPGVALPEIRIDGHLGANFPYILSHLEYIVGELLRNSVQAVAERHNSWANSYNNTDPEANWCAPPPPPPPPVEVTICESPQHVIIRISDQGGGIPRDSMPYLWSFSKGPASGEILANLGKVPKMAATMQELQVDEHAHDPKPKHHGRHARNISSSSSSSRETSARTSSTPPPAPPASGATTTEINSSLGSLSSRPPNLRLGMGLPLSRVYAEYWAGSLAVHSLEGYGVDAFLQISKLGNKNEQLTTRASMDAV